MKGYFKKRKRDVKGVFGSEGKGSNRTHARERGAGGERMLAGGRRRGEGRWGVEVNMKEIHYCVYSKNNNTYTYTVSPRGVTKIIKREINNKSIEEIYLKVGCLVHACSLSYLKQGCLSP